MIKKQLIFFFPSLFFFLLPLSFILCQQELPPSKERFEISYFIANQQWLDVDYHYKSSLVKASYIRGLSSERRLSFSIYFQPILGLSNWIKDKVSTKMDKGYEIGIGIGGRIEVDLYHTQLLWIFMLQTGPHYISSAPSRQLPGFLFSSEADTGLTYRLSRSTKINILLGFRHLSNGEIRLPNGGLNNLMMGIGVNFEL